MDDHIGVGTCVETKRLSDSSPSCAQVGERFYPLVRPAAPTSRAVLILKPLGVVDVNVCHNLRVAKERTPAFDLWLVLLQLPGTQQNRTKLRVHHLEFLKKKPQY